MTNNNKETAYQIILPDEKDTSSLYIVRNEFSIRERLIVPEELKDKIVNFVQATPAAEKYDLNKLEIYNYMTKGWMDATLGIMAPNLKTGKIEMIPPKYTFEKLEVGVRFGGLSFREDLDLALSINKAINEKYSKEDGDFIKPFNINNQIECLCNIAESMKESAASMTVAVRDFYDTPLNNHGITCYAPCYDLELRYDTKKQTYDITVTSFCEGERGKGIIGGIESIAELKDTLESIADGSCMIESEFSDKLISCIELTRCTVKKFNDLQEHCEEPYEYDR